MKFLPLLPLLCLALYSEIPADLNRPVLTSEEIAEINSIQSKWVASENWVTRQSLKDFLEGFKDSKPTEKHFRKVESPVYVKGLIPHAFDASVQWPNCVVPVYNQAPCSAGYAIAIAAVLSERLCISNQTLYTGMNFSSQYILSCNSQNLKCSGGYISNAWSAVSTTGTGVQSCQPYVGNAGCSNVCANGTPVTIYVADPTSITEFDNPTTIQQEIMARGAITGSMTVYTDFAAYTSGIYSPVTVAISGNQVVKIFGWGVSGTTNYWICANSYGTSWGMQGIFWIEFGVCSIDSLGYAGMINLN